MNLEKGFNFVLDWILRHTGSYLRNFLLYLLSQDSLLVLAPPFTWCYDSAFNAHVQQAIQTAWQSWFLDKILEHEKAWTGFRDRRKIFSALSELLVDQDVANTFKVIKTIPNPHRWHFFIDILEPWKIWQFRFWNFLFPIVILKIWTQ